MNAQSNTEPPAVAAPLSSPTRHTLARIGWLRDPKTLDALLDVFQSDGMPLGSNRWAEYCHHRLLELLQKEKTLRRMIELQAQMEQNIKYCGASVHRERRKRMTKEFQEESARREKEQLENNPAKP